MRLTCLKSASVCHHHCYINTNRQTINLWCFQIATPLKPLVSTPHWIWTVAKALRGIAARKLRHIRPHGNFMLSGVFNGWGDVNRHSSIISPLVGNLPTCWGNGFYSGEDTRAKRIHLWWLLMIVLKSLLVCLYTSICWGLSFLRFALG